MTMRVLIVEDDRRLAPLLVQALRADGVTAEVTCSGRDAVQRAGVIDYAVILLDVVLPDMNGFEVCRALRAGRIDAPVLMITGRAAIEDRVHGLDCGADDYLVKPFALHELRARVRAMSRRAPIRRREVMEVGDLRLDSARHQVWRGSVAIDLSRTEYTVLEALMREPGAIRSRADLLAEVWGDAERDRSNVVEVYVRYLREKIDRPFGRNSLQTIRGVGYRIAPDA